MREVFWDVEGQGLIKQPMQELQLLRNSTLYRATAVQLSAGKLFTPPLPAGAGATIDLDVSFDTTSSASTTTVGVVRAAFG
jgi:hypothetical protein